MSAARAQNSAAISGCGRSPQTVRINVDAGTTTKLTYRDTGNNDRTELHVCPGDTVVWTGKQRHDQLAISFAKEGGTDSPADDGQISTSGHRITKHIKKNHARLKYPYDVTLTRNGSPIADDPLIGQ